MIGSPEERVKSLADECGFDEVGFAEAGPVEIEVAEKCRRWVEEGSHASMGYMERRLEERLNPWRIMPHAKSVIVFLSNYFRDNPTQSSSRGKIARYAGGRDYHRVMNRFLRDFKRRMAEAFPGEEVWCETDTGPVLERYWAEKAGVGWVGKNAMLLNKRYGTWTFIAVALTTLRLRPAAPHPDHCGTCSRCLAACPTDAFVEPGHLDSNRCISYWTIEHQGETSPSVRENLNGWLFGCDDCQTVCPWNRHARETNRDDYRLRSDFEHPDLVRWAKWTWQEWDSETRGTALRRPGYSGWLRNCRQLLEDSE